MASTNSKNMKDTLEILKDLVRARLKTSRRAPLLLAGSALVIGMALLGMALLGPSEAEVSVGIQAESGSAPLPYEGAEPGALPALVAAPLPFELAEAGWVHEYQRGETLESWKFISELPCADYAINVIESIQSEGLELIEAGYMDLSGECWGCVFIGANNESLMVILLPERPFSPRSDTNKLAVNIIHYLQPEELKR